MGGRGASSGRSKGTKSNPEGNPYGSQYHKIFQSGNIKFVAANEGATEQLLETMTRGRVYVLVDEENKKLKNIRYFDNNLKKTKRIDLDHVHKGLKKHVEHGYFNNEVDIDNGVKREATKPTPEEKRMVARVKALWDNFMSSR